MGRRKTIDREKVLDAAEKIIFEQGSASLTIDTVAKAANITKGGIQSCFGTKDAMIDAMLQRCWAHYGLQIQAANPAAQSPEEIIQAHISVTADETDNNTSRAASLIANMLQSPDRLNTAQQWYTDRWQELSQINPDKIQQYRLAFLATEGIFFLKHFNLMKLDEAEWDQYFLEIQALISSHK